MIEGGGDASLIQQFGKLLGAFSAAGIDDGGTFHAIQDMQELLSLVGGFSHDIGEVFALEAHGIEIETRLTRLTRLARKARLTSLARQFLLDILYDGGGGCGGESQDGGLWYYLANLGNLQIRRAEVVAPL